jgi:hypothetical protein
MIERVLENLIDNWFIDTPEKGLIRLQLSAGKDSADISVSRVRGKKAR